METIVLPLSLYDVLLEAIEFDSPAEVLQRVTYYFGHPENSEKTKRALSYLPSDIIRLQKDELLELLIPILLEHNISVDAGALKEATKLPLQRATLYLDKLFALGWDINKALSNTEPPVLSIALHDTSLTLWLL